jgi:AcrR family transcriptional regulator
MAQPSTPDSPPTGRRKAQLEATRAALLEVAVETLIEKGAAGVTTLGVQQRAGVSRGALLHHFPTRAALLSATVERLVAQNEAALWAVKAETPDDGDALTFAIRVLGRAAASPSYLAELELWALSRTDPDLRETLRGAERAALEDRTRVLAALFGPIADRPGGALVIELSIELARGMALSGLLRSDPARHQAQLDRWAEAAKLIMQGRQASQGGAT